MLRHLGAMSRVLLGTTDLYAAVALRGFRRHATYRAATAAGAFTNTVFGFIRAYILLALWAAQPDIGDYSAVDAVTFCFIGQALIAPVGIFSPTVSPELTDRVRSGDIAIDLHRPADFQGWWLASDLGRAGHALIFRGLPPIAIGAFFFELTWPTAPAQAAGLGVSIMLAVLVSFGIRYLVTLTTFWLLDDTGTGTISMFAGFFFSGLVLPLILLPGWFGALARVTPWAAMIQTPSDIWLGVHEGADLLQWLGIQALWAVALLGLGRVITARARRRVVVQGG